MTFNKVSVLVPTRRRVARLQILLDSWKATVMDPTRAELLFRIDDDDAESKLYLADHDREHRVLVGPRLNGYRSIPQFLEELRSAATGDLYMLGNDDMAFLTPNWARAVIDEANKYPDGIFVLGCEVQNARNFVFPIVSKVAVDAMGAIMDPRLYWGDVYLRDVFAAFGRAIRFNDMKIDHQWAGRERDKTFVEAHQEDPANWNEEYWAKHREVVREAVERLRPLAVAA